MDALDLALVRRLIAHSDEGCGEAVQGQDVVLVLGETGVGKSTTVNYLAGCEMQTRVIDYSAKKEVEEPDWEDARLTEEVRTHSQFSPSSSPRHCDPVSSRPVKCCALHACITHPPGHRSHERASWI